MAEPLIIELFKDLYTILDAASSKCKVLDEKFPSEFLEAKPTKIYESYVSFLKSRSDSDGQLENEESLSLTTIRGRFEDEEYSRHADGIYRLYHDIRLVSTILIQYYSPGTRSYQMVDKFYKFATELLLRECYKRGVTFSNGEPTLQCKDDTEFSAAIAKNFIKISSAYVLPIVESYHINTKYGDLFSSTISTSQLNQRPLDLPNSNFEVTKVIPQIGNYLSNKLGFVAANTSNIPDPTVPPTEMMTKFLHPNWYALPTTLWLKYGGYESFAPTITENGSVIDSSRIGEIWLEKLGYQQLWKLNKQDSNESKNHTKDIPDLSANSTQDSETVENPVSAPVEDMEHLPKSPEVNNENLDTTQSTRIPGKISLENNYKWRPGNVIDDDELEAFRNNTQQELISQLLVKLQNLKRKRIQVGKVSKPTAKETNLYFKIQRMLKEVIVAGQVKMLPQMHVREFPVLQADYAGSIPVVRTYPNRKKKYKK
ncbi:HFL090Cp [Eremothecium sinecaudum]|uniref:HFL090Cp n=1 Tax=Eremothecium sinecaudum TaxID=45286 RepID=A0A120K2J7_9SACH|nr:HFL090Cp [Eremothecium sinecaudum]AMD21766.1 HFL090Cp [Eremothecium sinecaudum]